MTPPNTFIAKTEMIEEPFTCYCACFSELFLSLSSLVYKNVSHFSHVRFQFQVKLCKAAL